MLAMLLSTISLYTGSAKKSISIGLTLSPVTVFDPSIIVALVRTGGWQITTLNSRGVVENSA